MPVVVDVDGERADVTIAPGGRLATNEPIRFLPSTSAEPRVAVPMATLAHARSGDKGDNANIGVLARRPEFVAILRDYLTEDVVAHWFAHYLRGDVERYELPGIGGFNFVLKEALGGGGTSSLRIDPQGKCFAPILLDMSLAVPESVARAFALA